MQAFQIYNLFTTTVTLLIESGMPCYKNNSNVLSIDKVEGVDRPWYNET